MATTHGLHGVFLALNIPSFPHPGRDARASVGVLVTGEPGIGKGELALELITRGHALVADDAPRFECTGDGTLRGHCPEPFRGFLELRGLGILDLGRMRGPQALCEAHALDLAIHLTDSAPPACTETQRLQGDWRVEPMLGHPIPTLHLHARAGRNLALLVETAAHQHLLRASGYNAGDELSRRLARQLGKESP